jgi:hypothetical protein
MTHVGAQSHSKTKTHLRIYLAMKPGALSNANVSLNDGLYSEN